MMFKNVLREVSLHRLLFTVMAISCTIETTIDWPKPKASTERRVNERQTLNHEHRNK